MPDQSLQERFKRLKEAVLSKRPILKEILSKNGDKPLYDYARDYINVNLNPPIEGRQEEFLTTYKKEATRRFGAEIAEKSADQLSKHYFVSTADHHGPVCHPFFLNSNLLTVAPCFEEEDPHLKYVLVLACSNISVDNSSFPRGLIFHSQAQKNFEMQRLAFFSSNYRPSTVYTLPAYKKADVEKIQHQIQVKAEKKEITADEGTKLQNIFEEIYAKPEVLACTTYSEQISKTNFDLWKKFFTESGIHNAPDLLYLELESLVVQLLLDHHLGKTTTITEILFSPDYEPLIKQYFDGIFGAFSSIDQTGTYMFWGQPKTGTSRLQMWKKDNFLVSQDGSFKVELTPEAIKKALEDKELIPGLMLCFILVAFYYGVKCLGGFNQVNYLTYMKNAYIKMQVDRGDYRSIEVCARSQTKELCDGLTVIFLEDTLGKMVLATGLDLILHGSEYTWPNFSKIMDLITFEEALNPLMPEIYKITYPDTEWDPSLSKITDKDIIELTGLNDKMKACAFFKNA